VSSPKPCLGYPSRTAAIHALRVQGLNTREIADAIGIKKRTSSRWNVAPAARGKSRASACSLAERWSFRSMCSTRFLRTRRGAG
jgi:transposase